MRLRRSAIVFAATAAVVAVLVVMAASDHSARAGVPFEPDLGFNISNTPGDSSSPAGAFDPSGNGIIGWVDTTGGSPATYGSYTHDGGLTWETITDISQGSVNVQKPAVAASADTFAYVWIGDNDIKVRSSADAGETWNPPATLGPIAGSAQPLVQIDPVNPLNVYVVWNDSDGAGGNVYAARSFTGGQAWTPPKVVGQTFVGILPSLAVTSDGTGHISVVTQPAIDIFQWPVAGAQPTIDISFPYGARNAFLYRAEGVDIGGIQLMFDTRAVPTSVLTAHKGSGGWLGPTELSGAAPARVPRFSSRGANGVAVWEEGTVSDTVIKAALSKNGLGTFSEGVAVTVPGAGAHFPNVVLTDQAIFVSYIQPQGGPAPTGSPQEEARVAVAKIPPPAHAPLFYQEDADVFQDQTLEVLLTFLYKTAGLPQNRSVPEGVLETHAVPAFLSEHSQLDTLTDDIILRLTSFAGDPNCTGEVDLGDGVSMLEYLAGSAIPVCLASANVDCSDGPPNATDLLILLKYLGGLPYTVPADCMPINLDEPPG